MVQLYVTIYNLYNLGGLPVEKCNEQNIRIELKVQRVLYCIE